jgi:hypothetical protein
VTAHDDAVADAIALTEAVGRDETAHVAVLLRHMNTYEVAVTLAKLLSELVNDNARGLAICAACFRQWAAEAVNRK